MVKRTSRDELEWVGVVPRDHEGRIVRGILYACNIIYTYTYNILYISYIIYILTHLP